jgi:hypothetical protein
MKRVAGLLLFLLVLAVCSQYVLALKPSVEIRPTDPTVISKDSSFVLMVDPKTTEKPIRITWSVYDTGNIGIGSFPMVGGKGVCYFSNDDGNATCGPSPFTKSGPTRLYVHVVTSGGVDNVTEDLNISGIQIPLDDVYREGNTVYMNFYTPAYDSFTYKIYHDDFTFFTQGVLNRYKGMLYTGNKTLNPGVYYFAFFADSGGTYGTNLMRIVIPSGDYLTITTSKENYLTGEVVKITGTTNTDRVAGTIKFHNGTKAMDFGVDLLASNFSYEFRIPSTWPEGRYNLTTSQPFPKSLAFSIADLIELTPKILTGNVNESEDFGGIVILKNLGVDDINLSLLVSGDLEEEHVSLEENILEGGKSTILTVSIPNVLENLAGLVTVQTNLEVELGIPVNVYTEEPEEACPECPECPPGGVTRPSLEINPKIWSQNCMAGGSITQTVTLKNNGNSTLTQLTFDVDDVYSDNSLNDLKATGDLSVSLSGLSIGAGETEPVDISITPYNTGSYKGVITMGSGGDKAYMMVVLECFEDMESEISLVRGELDNLGLPSDSSLYTDIGYLLDNAQDAYDVGSYQEAKSNLDKAGSMISALQESGPFPPAGGIDLTIPVIVIIVILVVVLVYYFKFYRKGMGGEEAGPGEFDEEF